MSKVKIQGNASGTGVVTLTAPNTNTDRTITLPDDTQTLIGANASGNVGIGTSSPKAKFDVASDMVVSESAGLNDADIGSYGFYNTNASADRTVCRINAKRQNSAWGGYLTFETTSGSGALTEAMRINSAGIVTMPYQPAFKAWLSTEWTTNGVVNSGWSETHDNNNNFNQGTFTAPVTGVYHFDLTWDAKSSTTTAQILVGGSAVMRFEPADGGSNWETWNLSGDVKLSANDPVTISIDGVSGTNPFHMGSGYWGWFSGHLIG